MSSDGFHKRMADTFHGQPDKEEVWGFSVELPSSTSSGIPPIFVKWAETNELHQIAGLGFGGDFKGYQSQLDFKGLLLGEQVFEGAAHGEMIGRPAVWVARQLDDNRARHSWHFLDAPPAA